MHTDLVKAVTTSANKKLGVASTTYAPQVSCPTDCVFLGAGCYAERGLVRMVGTKYVNDVAEKMEATPIDVAIAEAKAIDEMATVVGRPLRLHTVGDCASDEAAQIVSAAAERYTKRGGGPVWSYSHAWKDVERSSWGDVSIFASCETAEQVKHARERGYATALVVDEFASDKLYEVGDVKILPCPAQTRHTTCSDCRLCFNGVGVHDRGYSIGFAIHGDRATMKRARETLRHLSDDSAT